MTFEYCFQVEKSKKKNKIKIFILKIAFYFSVPVFQQQALDEFMEYETCPCLYFSGIHQVKPICTTLIQFYICTLIHNAYFMFQIT